MKRLREIGLFLLVSLLVSIVIYRGALTGQTILAPVDIGPALFEQFSHVDEESSGVPENHHVIDQFTYDLPLQAVIWDSYSRGEIPWWDPYTYAGRPLLADAHVNGTDPVRILMYSILPFELAYNWNIVLRGILMGLGMFLLLRSLKAGLSVAVILAIVYSYSGWFALYFGHPWIAGSFLYYPYLWLVWNHDERLGRPLAIALGGLLTAGVFYAGNLQSHLYLPLFAGLLWFGRSLGERRIAWTALLTISGSGILGALLSFPVLFNQVEFFLLSERAVERAVPFYNYLGYFPFLGGSVYPWAFGTFRSLDLSKIVGTSGIAFSLFSGIAVSLFALTGFFRLKGERPAESVVLSQARLLLLVFIVVAVTPAVEVFYLRMSAMAGMALIVLTALTVEGLIAGKISFPRPLVKWGLIILGGGILLSSAVAWWVYPEIKPRISGMMEKKDAAGGESLHRMPELREFQVSNFPGEASILNPEALVTLVALLALGYVLLKGHQASRWALVSVLLISALPVLMFYGRFAPNQDVALWKRLMDGGDLQKKVIREVKNGRFFEESPSVGEMIFPNAFPALFRVHAVRGYSALQPLSLKNLADDALIPDPEWRADFRLSKVAADSPVPEISRSSQGARFRRKDDGEAAPVKILSESLNEIVVDTSHLPIGTEVVRTDTFYPGWMVSGGQSLQKVDPCFSKFVSNGGEMTLRYQPTSIRYAPYAVGFAMLGLGVLCYLSWRGSEVIEK